MKKLLSLNKYVKDEIDSRIKLYFDDKIIAASKIDPIYKRLLEDMQKYILRGGKRLRPTLMVLGYRAAGGNNVDEALDAALALEIFHNFVLIHDDVMDGDTTRYGGPNITGIYERRLKGNLDSSRARHTAEAIAILAGELNEAFTFEVLANLNAKAETRFAMMNHFQRILFETGAGQQLDVLSQTRQRLNLKNIDKVNYYKTAQYTITSPLQFGVIYHGNTNGLMDSLSEFGRELGEAFQLTDDLLGMFGSSKQTGKPVGSDIREGKQTLLMFYAKRLSKSLEWRAIETRLGKAKLTSEDVKIVRTILKECGAQAKVAVAAEDHLQKALAILDRMEIDDETKGLLNSFSIYCVERKK